MGKQIRVVQSSIDEKVFLGWLDKIDNFVCLPREMNKLPMEVLHLGTCESIQQVIFLRDFQAEIFGNIQRAKGKDFYHVYPKDGLCIEWDRTEIKNKIGYCPGRLFFEKRNAGWPDSAKKLDKHFNRISNYIKKKSPKRSATKFPIYVGSDLNKKKLTGDARIIFASGKEIELIKNAK